MVKFNLAWMQSLAWLRSLTIFSILVYTIRCQSGRPEILENVGNIHLTFCEIKEKRIDPKAYFDRDTGDYDLKLELLNEAYQIINSSDLYLNFDPVTRTIFAVHASNLNKFDFISVTRNYFLRATDKNGDFIDDNFTLTIDGNSLPGTHEIIGEFIADVSINEKSDVEVMYILLKRLNEIYGDKNNVYDQLHVQNFTRVPSLRKLDIVFQNCTLQSEYLCESGILKPIYGNGPTKQMTDGLAGTFAVNSILLRNSSYCALKRGTYDLNTAKFNPKYVDRVLDFTKKQFPGIYTEEINYYEFLYSETLKTFYPIIETILKGESKFTGGNGFWAQFVWRNNKLYFYSVFMTKFNDTQFDYGDLFIVSYFRVMRSSEISDSYEGRFIFQVRQSIPENHNYYINIYFFNLKLKLFNEEPFTPYLVVNMYYFMEALQLIFNGRFEIYLMDFKFTNFATGSGVAQIGFLMASTVCDYEFIRQVQSEVFENGNIDNVNSNFANKFSSTTYNIRLSVTRIEEFYDYKCRKNPPKLVNELPIFRVSFCGIASYVIPRNTFYDDEDGTNLQYEFLDSLGNKLDLDSWIRFDSSSLNVSAILTENMAENVNRLFVYTIKVTDSSNLTSSTEFKVQLVNPPNEVVYRIQITGNFKKPLIYNPGFRLAETVQSYVKSTSNTFQLIVNAKTSQNRHILQFTSCSWSTNPCPELQISKYKIFFFDDKNMVTKAFLDLISEDYDNFDIQQSYLNTCRDNKSPVVQNKWGPHQINPCASYELTVPENTFYDQEEGFTRSLKLKMFSSSSSETLPKWISFDEEKQILSMVPYHETVDEVRLHAYDLRGQFATNRVQIKNTFDKNHTLIVKMRFTVSDPSLETSFTKLYGYLREKLQIYFRDTNVNTVEYISASFPSTIYEVEWTNCSLSKEICEREKIDEIRRRLINTDENKNSRNNLSLRDLFKIYNIDLLETISVTESGVCLLKPIVVNPLPALNLGYCGGLRYIIPENTFRDPKDGTTRNLKLSLTDEKSNHVSLNWINFDSPTQTLFTILSSQELFSQRVYKFKIQATTKRLDTVSTDLFINIVGEPLVQQPYLKFMFGFPSEMPLSQIGVSFLEALSKETSIPVNNLHAYSLREETESSDTIYFANIQECNVPCDKQKIRKTENAKIYLKTLNPFLIYTSEFFKENDCGPDFPPKINGKLNDVDVKQCGVFSYKIDPEIFEDEDVTLTYVIASINGKPSDFDWIGLFDGILIQGVITNEVLERNPSRILNVTIRAYDRKNQFNETWFLMKIEQDESPQLFYKYSMKFKQTVSMATDFLDARRQILVVEYIEEYFKSKNLMNIMSYNSVASNEFSVEWSVCNLPNTCTEAGLSVTANQIFLTKTRNQIKIEFLSIFQKYFQLMSATIISDDVTKQTYSPPIATISTKTINLAYCGGFSHQFASNLFKDEQQKDMRSLQVFIETIRGRTITTDYSYINYEEKTQTIYGIATYDEALKLNQLNQQFTLRARDSCGLEASIAIYFSFELPSRPLYIYAFNFLSVGLINYETRKTFMNKIRTYDSSTGESTFGYISFTSTKVEIFNCSISYSPCDLYLLETIKKAYTDGNNLPSNKFQTAMLPEFDIKLVSPIIDEKCRSPLPPLAETSGPYQISICGYYSYQVPEDLFYDYQEGYTRNLKISFSSGNAGDDLQSVFALSTSKVQAIDVIPTAELMNKQKESGYDLVVTATNKFNLQARTTINLNLYGPNEILQECQIQVTLKAISAIEEQRSSVQTMAYVKEKLVAFFGVEDWNLGIVTFYKKSGNEFYFSFSYCSALYHQLGSQASKATVDYYNLQKLILIKIFQENRMTVSNEFRNVFTNEFTVETVKTAFSGRCKNLPPICPISTNHVITMIISYGGYYSYQYQRTLFYDFEDGWADALTLQILDAHNESVFIDNWVNIDFTSYKIYAVIYDQIRFSTKTMFTYFIQATDSMGLQTRIRLVLNKDDVMLRFAPFNFTYYLQYTGQSNIIYAKESSYIIDSIFSYFNSISVTQNIITSKSMILVRWYYQISGHSEYRVFYYSIASETCASTILTYMKTLYTQVNLNGNLVSSLSQMFTMKRFTIQTKCNLPPTPPPKPYVPTVIPTLNITYCELFYYTISKSSFFDPQLGIDATKMDLELLDATGHPVGVTSWLQLNKATLEIYAIAIQSQVSHQSHVQQGSSHTFQIRATSSAGGEVTSQFKVNVVNFPYTSDCYQNATFKYKYESSKSTQLDIIVEFVSILKLYYGDNHNDVKVIEFRRISKATYYIQWSNCTFQFQSLTAAKSGLTESSRPQLEAIFSKVESATKSNIVNLKFEQRLSTYFELLSFATDDNCIEEPPIPNQSVDYIFHTTSCELLNRSLPRDTFYDKRDGDASNLKLSLETIEGNPLSIYEWVKLDQYQNIYGAVTKDVKDNSPPNGYVYMLKAEDSSGRSSKLKITIQVNSVTKWYDVKFRTSFINHMTSDATADTMYYFSKLITEYLDTKPNRQIYIHHYTYPSEILWSSCDIEKCLQNIDTYNLVRRKLITADKQPAPEFSKAMQPRFTIMSTRIELKELGICGEVGPTIKPPPVGPNTTIPKCGFFTYSIPRNYFVDLEGLTTHEHLLGLSTLTGQQISISSNIQFNTSQQYVYGFVAWMNAPRYYSFQLAAQHPISGYKISSIMTIHVTGYNSMKRVISSLCYFDFRMETHYNRQINDAALVYFFTEVLSNYFKRTISEVQIYSYERYTKDTKFYFSVRLTNCTLTELFIEKSFSSEYYTGLQFMQQQLFSTDSKGEYTALHGEIKDYFSKNSFFTLESVTKINCTKPPNPPPVARKPWRVDVACGYFEEKVPNDLFELNGRPLAEMLLKIDSKEKWFYLNITQYLVGVVNTDLVNSTINGRKEFIFNLQLTDTQGQSASTEVIVTLNVTLIQQSQSTTSFPLWIEGETERPSIYFQVLLMQRLYYFLEKEFPGRYGSQALTVSSVVSLAPLIPILEIYVRNCYCSAGVNRLLIEFDKKKTPSNRDLFTNFIASFPLPISEDSIENTFRFDVCQEFFSPYLLRHLSVNYCEFWKYKLSNVFGETIINFDVRFYDADKKKVSNNNWVWLNNYTLEAFPPTIFWLFPDFRENYTLELHISKDFDFLLGDPYFYEISLNKSANIPSQLVDYTITLEEDGPRSRSYDNYYISAVFNALAELVNSTKNIHFSQFNKLQANPFRFEVKWENCSLPFDCSNKEVEKVNSIIHNSQDFASLNIIKYLPPNLKPVGLTSKCYEEKKPLANGSLLLNIPVCGIFKYKISFENLLSADDFDINDYDVSLKSHDLKSLAEDTWINYKKEEQMIYALPTEAIASVHKVLHFQLELVNPKRGETVTVPVNITVADNKKTYYEFSFGFRTNGNLAYLDLQIKVIELISKWTESRWRIEDFRVIEFTQTGTLSNKVFYLKFGICSYHKQICKAEENEIEDIEKSIIQPPTAVKQAFIQYFIDATALIPFYAERRSSVLTFDSEPRIISELEKIILSQCESKTIRLTQHIYDNEQNFTSLKLTLKFQNGNLVPRSYWVQLSGSLLLIYPKGGEENGEHKFLLEAKDRCENSVVLRITVQIVRKIIPIFTNYTYWTISLKSPVKENQPDVYYINYIKSNIVKFFLENASKKNLEDDFYVVTYTREKNQLEFSLCSIIEEENCDFQTIYLLGRYIFMSNSKEPNPSFEVYFKDYPINTIREEINCNGPRCDDIELAITMCDNFEYVLLDNICSDGNTGNLKNMRVELLSREEQKLPMNYWLGLENVTRKLYGFPISSLKQSDNIEKMMFLIKAVNGDNQYAYIRVTINMTGNRISSDIQLITSPQSLEIRTTKQTYVNQICLAKKIKNYFLVSNVSFNGIESRNIKVQNGITILVDQYSWGFCEKFTDVCNCNSMKEKQKIFDELKFNDAVKTCTNLQESNLLLSGSCKNNEKPQLINGINEFNVKVGEYQETQLPSDQFADAEEGANKYLTLNIHDFDDSKFNELRWLNIEDNKICGLLAYQEFTQLGYTTDTKLTYDVSATDSCGNKNSDQIDVTFRSIVPSLKYKLFLTFIGNHEEFSGNCTKIKHFTNAIESYTKVPSTEFLIEKFGAQNKTSKNGTNIEIKLPCENEDDELLFEKFSTELEGDEKISSRDEFIEFMQERGFHVNEIYDGDKKECESCWWCWWLPILLILLLLILLLWLLWYCIPRCCLGCCGRFFPFCNPCCSKGGVCSSVRKGASSPKATTGSVASISPRPGDTKDSMEQGKGKGEAIDSIHSGGSGGGTYDRFNTGATAVSTASSSKHSSSHGKYRQDSVDHLTNIALPLPYKTSPNRTGQDIEYQTESWSDKRPLIKYVRRRTTSLDKDSKQQSQGMEQQSQQSKQQSQGMNQQAKALPAYEEHKTIYEKSSRKNEERDYGKDYQDFFYSKDGKGYYSNEDGYDTYTSNFTLPKPVRNTVSDDEFIRKRRLERSRRNERQIVKRDRSPVHVHARKPVTLRVRRSILKDYLRQKGRSVHGKISLNDRDIQALLNRDATLKISEGGKAKRKQKIIRSDSRLADALIDPSFQWENKTPRRSTTSDDVTGIDQYGQEVVISPRNITLTFDGSDIRTTASDDYIPYIPRQSHKRRSIFRRNSRQITPRSTGITKRRSKLYQRSNRSKYDVSNKGADNLRYEFSSL